VRDLELHAKVDLPVQELCDGMVEVLDALTRTGAI
jgi:hypothetical protein